WNERITDSLQQLKNNTVCLCDQVLPDNFYVLSMCFDNKDGNLYILDNKNTIRCIALDTGLFNNEHEIIYKEQYSKVMMTLEGGYVVGIKPHEQKEKEEEKEKEQLEQTPTVQAQVQSSDNDNVATEGNAQIPSGITDLEVVKRTPTGLIQCDFYVLDDSKELVRSLVFPKEFTSNGINDMRFKLILQNQIYLVFLDDQFVLHCLPLQVSSRKSQLHVELISIYGDLTISNDKKVQTRKPSKLDYIEYKFYSQPKLALHLSVLLDANENKSSSSSSWISRERIAQASELVLHTCDK
ncbi:hypothetical protein RFI_34304, partial [Reticulomyxa filosa]